MAQKECGHNLYQQKSVILWPFLHEHMQDHTRQHMQSGAMRCLFFYPVCKVLIVLGLQGSVCPRGRGNIRCILLNGEAMILCFRETMYKALFTCFFANKGDCHTVNPFLKTQNFLLADDDDVMTNRFLPMIIYADRPFLPSHILRRVSWF